MKRIISAIFTLFLLLTLAGCSAEFLSFTSDSTNADDTVISSDITTGDPVISDTDDTSAASPQSTAQENNSAQSAVDENSIYTSKDDVALYIHTYGKLPSNFITKKEAEALGWSGGSLEPYAPEKCIGGDRFGNYEGLLPEKSGRTYTECDIDTLNAKSRGAKRIVFSNDGLIYYTDDHYESFTLLYGEE